MSQSSLIREVLSSTLGQLLATGIFAVMLWFGGTLLLPALSELSGAAAAALIVMLGVCLVLTIAWLIVLLFRVRDKSLSALDFAWDDNFSVHLDSKTQARYCPVCMAKGTLGRMKFFKLNNKEDAYQCTVCYSTGVKE